MASSFPAQRSCNFSCLLSGYCLQERFVSKQGLSHATIHH
uniref:Uncharacterized protein n=1 Tax=Arundo donax TaxID=35708 RepID=A0A0A9EPF3_ARUDO